MIALSTPASAAPCTAPRTPRDADLARADGAARISFARSAGGETRLEGLAQRSPVRVLRPLDDAAEAVAVVLNTAGGICGGDRLALEVSLGPGSAATVTSQAAEKVYRAIDSRARLRTTLRVAAGAAFHWAPRETIVFDGARFERQSEIRAQTGARWLAAETLVFGRRAMGETVSRLDLRDDWRVHVGDALIWADALELVGEPPEALAAACGLDGSEALATVLWTAPESGGEIGLARECLAGHELRAGVTALRGIGLARLIGSASAVREALTALLSVLRLAVLGFAPVLPRAWSL